MKNEYEIVRHANLRHINSFVINITYRNFHMHSDFELLLALEGCGTIKLKNDFLAIKSGDAVLINPHEVHDIDARENGLKLIVIQFSRHFCNAYFPGLRNTRFKTAFLKSCFSDEAYIELQKTAAELTATYIKQEELYEFQCVILLTKLLILFYRHSQYEMIDESEYAERKKRSERMNRISSHIDANYLYPIRLQDIAEQEQISVTHLSHFFTENFGITFQEYLNSKRLEQALRLAANKQLPTCAIAEMSGFSDAKYLNKAFENKFGYPFKQYKKSAGFPAGGTPAAQKNTLQQYYTKEESLKVIQAFQSKNCPPSADNPRGTGA